MRCSSSVVVVPNVIQPFALLSNILLNLLVFTLHILDYLMFYLVSSEVLVEQVSYKVSQRTL